MDPGSLGSPGREPEPAVSMPPPPTGEVVRPTEGAGLTPPPGSTWGPLVRAASDRVPHRPHATLAGGPDVEP
jgi:hypothetical protein